MNIGVVTIFRLAKTSLLPVVLTNLCSIFSIFKVFWSVQEGSGHDLFWSNVEQVLIVHGFCSGLILKKSHVEMLFISGRLNAWKRPEGPRLSGPLTFFMQRGEKHTGYWGCHWGFSDHVIIITRYTLRYNTSLHFAIGRQEAPTSTCYGVITSLASNSFL